MLVVVMIDDGDDVGHSSSGNRVWMELFCFDDWWLMTIYILKMKLTMTLDHDYWLWPPIIKHHWQGSFAQVIGWLIAVDWFKKTWFDVLRFPIWFTSWQMQQRWSTWFCIQWVSGRQSLMGGIQAESKSPPWVHHPCKGSTTVECWTMIRINTQLGGF